MAVLKLKVCDICKADGEIRLAKSAYKGDGGVIYHACASCTRNIKGYEDIPIVEIFYDPGDPDPLELYA